MKYFKCTEGDYIILVGTDIGGEEITREEYDSILSVIENRPASEIGYIHKLRTDLSWEKVEVSVVDSVDPEDYTINLNEL